MASAYVLTCANPNGVGVGRVYGDITNGIRRLVIEYRLPGRAAIDGLPHATAAHCHVPNAAIARVSFDICNTP